MFWSKLNSARLTGCAPRLAAVGVDTAVAHEAAERAAGIPAAALASEEPPTPWLGWSPSGMTIVADLPGCNVGRPSIRREPSPFTPEPIHSVSPVALTNVTRSPATAADLVDMTTIRPSASTTAETNATFLLRRDLAAPEQPNASGHVAPPLTERAGKSAG